MNINFKRALAGLGVLGAVMALWYCTDSIRQRIKISFLSKSDAIVTFIIPSVNRPTLQRTIHSLQQQNNPNWEAIIVFDGVEPSNTVKDPRIKILQCLKTGVMNHAGEVRNKAMQHVKTEWIAFVDDDDSLSRNYVDCLVEESKLCPDASVVIFRMWHNSQQKVFPLPNHTDFSECCVGISFSIKTNLYQSGIKFQPGPTEDFQLLDTIRKGGHKMVISPYITYWVRSSPSALNEINEHSSCTRAYIN